MRISSVAVFIGILVSSTIPALAFYPSGTIKKGLSYDSVEITRGHYVSGKLYNRTNKPVKVEGLIKFLTIHRQLINYARIYVTVPPNDSARFHCRLVKNNYKEIKHAYSLKWDVACSSPVDRRRSYRIEPHSKSTDYGNTRASGAYVKVFGRGNYSSDQFELKTGLYIVKVSHTGKHRCRIILLRSDGSFAWNITNGTGYIVESRNVQIEGDGYFLLEVLADGDWTVSIEYHEPNTAQGSGTPGRNAAGGIPDNSGSADPVVIKLKNGRTLHADSYWEEGDKLKVSIYNAVMTVDKKDVKEIVAPTP